VTVRVDVNSELLARARERSGVEYDDILRRFPRFRAWEEGAIASTLKQLGLPAPATAGVVPRLRAIYGRGTTYVPAGDWAARLVGRLVVLCSSRAKGGSAR
jgi:hypothetical protein